MSLTADKMFIHMLLNDCCVVVIVDARQEFNLLKWSEGWCTPMLINFKISVSSLPPRAHSSEFSSRKKYFLVISAFDPHTKE